MWHGRIDAGLQQQDYDASHICVTCLLKFCSKQALKGGTKNRVQNFHYSDFKSF